MSDDKKYHGWTNYETWVVKLWMNNEPGPQEYWSEQAQAYVDDSPHGLAEQLRREHEDILPDLKGFAADLLSAAMSEVNWHEIAESLINDAKEALA